MSDNLKVAIIKAGVKTLAVFVVIHILDYFIESKMMDRFKEYGTIGWIIFFVIFMITNLIELKFKKDKLTTPFDY